MGANVQFLTVDQAEAIKALPYVERVVVFTLSAVEYDLPDRPAGRENDLQTPIGAVSLPDAIVTGTGDSSLLADFQSGAKELREGRLFTVGDAGKDVIVIDQETATFEELKVGDRIVVKTRILPEEGGEPSPEPQFREVEAEIIGIYADLEASAQGGFSAARMEAWYTPIEVVRQLQSPDSQLTVSTIQIVYDTVDHVGQLTADLEEMLDPELFAVTTTEERFEDISDPVETMRSSSLVGTVAGLVVVGLIMVMLMALVVSGRMREIGILKAVGARNRHVILQFAAETIGLAAVAVLVAVPTVLVTNNLVADALRPDATVEEAEGDDGQNGPGPGAGGAALTDPQVIVGPVGTEEREAVLERVDASLSPEVIAMAAAIAVGLGLLGALVPIAAVLRLRPAEVLRLEG
ncbi:MAG: hypothetical protein A2148_02165 [Chloroflexi bacterium RBG_16_68_14]|nr:MAG: hypothetical protein A2148_02165 [Chloroflexi bacterium RBG_16_68_14]